MRIRLKLTLAFLLIALLPLGCLGAILYHQARGSMIQETLLNLEANVARHEVSLEAIVEHHREVLGLLTSRTQLRRSLRDHLRSGGDRGQHLARIHEILDDALASTRSVQAILVLDPEGQWICSTDPGGQPAPGAAPSGTGSADPFLRYVAPEEGDDGGHLRARGALEIDGEFLGHLEVVLSLEPLTRIIQDYRGLGETGELLLAIRDSTGAAHFIIPRRFESHPAALASIPADRQEFPIIQALQRKEAVFFDTLDYRGQHVLSATRHLDSVDWGLVAKQDLDEALASVHDLGRAFLLSCLGALLISTVTGLGFGHSLIRPITRLTHFARNVRVDHPEALQEELNRVYEELGDDEMGDLARAFQKFTNELNLLNRDLEKRIAERTRDLERSNRELTRFAYTASHDLKVPLVSCKGFLGLLRRDLEKGNPEAVEDSLQEIEGATTEMAQLIEDLLEYSRVTRSPEPLSRIHLPDLLEQLERRLSLQLGEQGMELEVDPDLPDLVARPAATLQVFQNLIENAIKYGKANRPSRIRVHGKQVGDELRYCVEDEGPGVPPEFHDRIFQLFERLDRESEGTGVGLAIVQKILEAHGGRVWIQPESPAGAAFWVAFPAKVSPEDSSTEPRMEAGPGSAETNEDPLLIEETR